MNSRLQALRAGLGLAIVLAGSGLMAQDLTLWMRHASA